MVEVKGAVFRPGMYQIGEHTNSVRTLIQAASGVTEFAFAKHAIIHRMKPDRKLTTIAVDIEGIMNETLPDVTLQNEDVLFVPTRTDQQEEETLKILGEVQFPGTYVFSENTTVEDLILQAGGLKNSASTSKVEVSRRIVNPAQETVDSIMAQTFTFKLKDGFVIEGEPSFVLQPYDEVFVHQSAGYTVQQNVTVEGQVMFSGVYSLSKRETRLSDIIKMAGGPNQYAYVKGARLERKVNDEERHKLEEALDMARREQQSNMMETALGSTNAMAIAQLAEKQAKTELQKFQIPNSYTVGIELDKALANPGGEDDLILREGDRIIIPQYNGTVRINGAVLHPNTVAFKKGKKISYYINQAGGYSKKARNRHTYIIYMNGMTARIGSKTKVEPGCEIIVPSKAQGKMTVAEKMMMATSATSMGTMAATIANLLK
jgi:protein involved in polysaccharide export with SLBB domain